MSCRIPLIDYMLFLQHQNIIYIRFLEKKCFWLNYIFCYHWSNYLDILVGHWWCRRLMGLDHRQFPWHYQLIPSHLHCTIPLQQQGGIKLTCRKLGTHTHTEKYFKLPSTITTSSSGCVSYGYLVPFSGEIIMAPWTVARDQSLWACHHRVPSSVENMTSWVKFFPGWIGHCVMFSGPSDQGFLGCFTPCL